MTVTVLIFYTRRPEVTPDDFRSHMEDVHLPIIREVFETHQPLSYRIRFTERVCSGIGDRLGAVTSMTGKANPNDPVLLVGEPKDLDWDAMSEMIFRDELHVQQCLAIMNEAGGERIKDDEDMFAIAEKTRAVIVSEYSAMI